MRKALKYLVGGMVLLVVATLLWLQFGALPQYHIAAPELTVTADSALLAEGARLVEMNCAHCHAPHGSRQMKGKKVVEAPADLGTFWAPNITHHPDSRLADYTDGELAVLIRTGVQRDGRWLPGPMPAQPLLSDRDLQAIIAFLRSDHPRMAPSDAVHPRSQLSLLGKFVTKVVARPVAMPTEAVPEPDTSDPLAWGYYLAAVKYDCYNCHSANFATNRPDRPELSEGYFGGGNKLIDPETGKPVFSANLTPHPEHGIGNWTLEQFSNAVRYGQHPDGRRLRLPMTPYAAMTDAEVGAIYAYLQSIPALDNEVDRGWE